MNTAMKEHSIPTEIISVIFDPDEETLKLITEALQMGRFGKSVEVAQSLHKMDLSTDDIAKITGLSIREVEWAKNLPDE